MNSQQIVHPLLSHKLTILRDRKTRPAEFRAVLGEMSGLLAYEATRDLVLKTVGVDTPVQSEASGHQVDEKLLIVSIMRAGNGMLDAVLSALPFAEVGHIGIYRDKFIRNTVEYFFRLPDQVEGRRVLLLDPLLATGDTAVAAIQRLKEYGVGRIQFICLLASPEGLARVHEQHPDTQVHYLALEPGLDDNGYLLPGLGDAGDRIYGTV